MNQQKFKFELINPYTVKVVSGTGFAGGISEAFGKKNLGKGVKVEINL